MHRTLLDYHPGIEVFESAETSLDRPAAEMQLAAELLDHIDDGELEGYLVELIDRAGRTADRPVRSALASILERTARRLLRPTGAPPVKSAGRVFGLELEGLSPEDKAFEVARQLRALCLRGGAPRGQRSRRGAGARKGDPRRSSAARTLAPGLLGSAPAAFP